MTKDKHRIMLVYPPSETHLHSSCPLGILMLASVLETVGHKVTVVDANARRNRRSVEDIVRLVERNPPDVIGVTILTPGVQAAYALAARLRKSGIRLLAGGPHASVLPEEAITHGFDAAVIGEGEVTVVEAIAALLGSRPKDSVKGWAYRDEQGAAIRTEQRSLISDLDRLPLAARHLVDPLDYGANDNEYLHGNLFSSRGCNAKCSFCSGQLFGKGFRFRSPESILEEIFQCYQTYGTRHFRFWDDALTADRGRFREICNGLRTLEGKVVWSMLTRIDLVDEETLVWAASAGCIEIQYGVESGDPNTLRRIHKTHTVAMVKRIVPLTAKCGIKPHLFFIQGFPWETAESISMTRHLIRELSPYVGSFDSSTGLLIPFPGTEIYETYKGEYGFENWWLEEGLIFKRPGTREHAYCEAKVYFYGTVLDANFFGYSESIKQEIYRTFRLIHQMNQRSRPAIFRTVDWLLLELSEKLHRVFPRVERVLFRPLLGLQSALSRFYHCRLIRSTRKYAARVLSHG